MARRGWWTRGPPGTKVDQPTPAPTKRYEMNTRTIAIAALVIAVILLLVFLL